MSLLFSLLFFAVFASLEKHFERVNNVLLVPCSTCSGPGDQHFPEINTGTEQDFTIKGLINCDFLHGVGD